MHLQLRQPIGVFKSSRVGTVEDRPARPHRARVCVRLCLCACRAHTCACICMCIHQPKQAQTRRYKPLTHITHGVCVCVCVRVCVRAHTHTHKLTHARTHQNLCAHKLFHPHDTSATPKPVYTSCILIRTQVGSLHSSSLFFHKAWLCHWCTLRGPLADSLLTCFEFSTRTLQ